MVAMGLSRSFHRFKFFANDVVLVSLRQNLTVENSNVKRASSITHPNRTVLALRAKRKAYWRRKKQVTQAALPESKSSAMEEDRSENRDSCYYYPGCKKDANCDCEICLASINATLDLMPMSIQKSSLTKLSAWRPSVQSTPISFGASVLSTPKSSNFLFSSSPLVKSNARSKSHQKKERGRKKWGFSSKVLKLVLCFSLILSADVVFSWVVSGMFRPVLSPDLVKRVGEKSQGLRDLNGKLRFLQKELQDMADGEVSNCSNANSVWQISQDGLVLNSRCTMYKSAVEEVAIWGWPLQTAGLLTTGFSFRTFTILSGRITKWPGGGPGYLIRKENASWEQLKCGATVVQLDPNTWVLEYKRSSIFYNSRLYSAALDFLKYKISRIVRRVKKEFWLFAAFEDHRNTEFRKYYGTKIPT